MRVRYHLLFSILLVYLLQWTGYGAWGMFWGLFFSILPDIDHLMMGRDIGTFSPPAVYRYYKDLRAEGIKEPAASRFMGFRYPLHNFFVALAAFLVYLPAGAGLLFHQALDLIDLLYPRGNRRGAF